MSWEQEMKEFRKVLDAKDINGKNFHKAFDSFAEELAQLNYDIEVDGAGFEEDFDKDAFKDSTLKHQVFNYHPYPESMRSGTDLSTLLASYAADDENFKASVESFLQTL